MAQDKNEIEIWYENKDPWEYEKNPDDWQRREYIRSVLEVLAPRNKFYRALDIGCGEGFITEVLPARHVYGIEISDNAAERLRGVKRVFKPQGKYDLIVATGVLYEQYDYKQFHNWIALHAKGIVLTCNIKDWEKNYLPNHKQIFYAEFPYRDHTQVMRVYKW